MSRRPDLESALKKLELRVSPVGELGRLSRDEPQCWTSPIRGELIAKGLVEVVLDDDQRWRGDRLTLAGAAQVARSA